MIKTYNIITGSERIIGTFEVEGKDEDDCDTEADNYLDHFIEGLRVELE